MEKSSSLSNPIQSLSATQRLLLVLVGIVIAFLILGSITQSDGGNGLNIGIQTQPFLVLAFLSFGGGLLSFVSPCTLPVLTAYFAFAFQSGRSQIAANTLAFMLGLATTFSLLGAVGFALGRVLLRNQQLILLVGGAFIIVFGVMSLLGKGFTGMQSEGSGAQPKSNSLGGSYLFGLTFAIGWSSCVGPILGSVLTLAAQTTSVWNGMMLLFIYTLGLGLPLILVSTFFGRMSRKSLFWRALRGKGWEWHTHVMVVGLVWALAVWRILVAVGEYAFRQYSLFGGTFTTTHEYGLLVIALLGAALWVFTSSEEKQTVVHLHTTQLVSGALFILIGVMMLNGTLTTFNNLVPPEITEWFIQVEEKLIGLFN
ncbi:MAG: cytochrome c biogenesis protein CcdA [Anaerolineales bacterium]|nr:cytochrome c biogenesis protein CcdA [Anaerolineales bacterium]MCA9929072.1 cytochrome c biogenesis protein CcdA [Anaerolineales bacterium]